MPKDKSRISFFWKELKRRNVIKVLAFYAGIGFVLIELANNVSEPLNMPEWTPRLVILLVIVGVPVAAILSWIFDVTPEGIQKVPPLDTSNLRNSIAVLPFQDMSPEKDQEYFCDGIAEEIINALTHLGELKVIARTSSFAFKNQNVDVREIGNKLDVKYLLEGSVRKAGAKLRITAQLIKLDDGTHLYSERFDRDMSDIFEIQDEITLAIIEKLKIKLLKEEKALLKRSTENSEIYNSYLLARYLSQKPLKADLERALKVIQDIKKKDPGYASAYQIEGFIYITLGGGYLSLLSMEEAKRKSVEAFQNAISIDPGCAEAHAFLGTVYMNYERDLAKSKVHFEKAMALEPENIEVQRNYAFYLQAQRRSEEAITLLKKLIVLDPLSPYLHQNLSAYYAWNRQYDLCIKHALKSLEIEPAFEGANWYLGVGYYHSGEKEKAIEIWESSVNIPHVTHYLLGYAYAKAGDERKLNDLCGKLEERKKQYPADIELAYIALGKGETDNALAHLSTMVEGESSSILFLSILYDPFWDPVRDSAEFKEILKKFW